MKQILFSAPMIRALLAGTKVQTRRVVKPQPRADQIMPGEWSKAGIGMRNETIYDKAGAWHALDVDGNDHGYRCPYGVPGDRLWVRDDLPIASSGFVSATAWQVIG